MARRQEPDHPDPKVQAKRARNRIDKRVLRGYMPRPDSLECVDCKGPAAEYDHHLGHANAVSLVVEAVCIPCHGTRRKVRGEAARGTRNGTAKLSDDAVRCIRGLSALGFTQHELSAMYSVSPSNVNQIVRRLAWSHVESAL